MSIKIAITDKKHNITSLAPDARWEKRMRLAFDEIQWAIGLDLNPLVEACGLTIAYPKSGRLFLNCKRVQGILTDNNLIEIDTCSALTHEIGHWLVRLWTDYCLLFWNLDKDGFYCRVRRLLEFVRDIQPKEEPLDGYEASLSEIWARIFEVWVSVKVWRRDDGSSPWSCHDFEFYQNPVYIKPGFDRSSGKTPGDKDLKHFVGYCFASAWFDGLHASFRRWPRKVVREILDSPLFPQDAER